MCHCFRNLTLPAALNGIALVMSQTFWLRLVKTEHSSNSVHTMTNQKSGILVVHLYCNSVCDILLVLFDSCMCSVKDSAASSRD